MRIIEVTQRHINKGKRGIPDACPIAHAVKEQLELDCFPEVDGNSIDLEGDVYYKTPRSAQRFIRKFDKLGRKAVKPFRFKLV